MRLFSQIILSIIFISIFVFGIFLYANSGADHSRFSSPVPDTLSKVFYPSERTNNFWLPHVRSQSISSNTLKNVAPEIQAKAAISYDLASNTLLLDKNMDQKLPIASLTKVMTAIVALENGEESDQIEVTQRAATIGEDSMGLTTGETLTVKELLYGLFLNSGNDAAEALAQSSPFGRDNFIHQMNKKAEDLGLSSTHFTNPTGLQGDGDQYSTAHDLLVITRYALEKPAIAEVARLPYMFIPYTNTHKAYELYNETNLLTTYPGVKGMKTGFTDEAGLCLITYLEYGGHKIIAIVLNSPSRRDEMIQILDYSLKSLGVKPPAHG